MSNDGSANLPDPALSWLSAKEFAAVAGNNNRNASDACKRCYEGRAWHGVMMVVRKRNGRAYEVFAPSLPSDLYAKWLAAQPKSPVPVQETGQLQALPEKPGIRLPESDWIEDAKWKRALIEPALAHPRGSRERGSVIKDIAAIEHTRPDGRATRIKARTLSDWIKSFEADGLEGLVRQRRHDTPRVFVTRVWDASCPLPDETKSAIGEAIKTYIKSLWRTANPGCNNTARLATTELQRLCHEAGWHGATLQHCRITRAAVEKYRPYSLAHTYRKDHKTFFNDHQARSKRDHQRLRPMEQLVGDVHPLDVLVRREDGSPATPRFIAWYDVATHRLGGTVRLYDAGTGVTQADVWDSFDEIVEKWGLPTHLYLDNGSEYFGRPKRFGEGVPNAVMKGFNELTGLVLAMREFDDAIKAEFTAEFLDGHPDAGPELRRNGVTRAMPYNAPGKTGIEGAFAALEKVMKMGPGYIGGNRMNKRTHKLGKETPPWPDIDSFVAAFTQFLAYWNGKEQRGNLDGISPNQAWADAQQDGWRAVKVEKMARLYAMSETIRCTVTRGTVTVDGCQYEDDALLKLSGKKIAVRYAKWAPEYLIYSPDFSKPLDMVLLKRSTRYHPFDQEGAREAARRNGVQRNHIRSLEAETEELDMVEVIARDNAARESAPATEFGPTLFLGRQVEALTESAKRLGPAAPLEIIPLQPGESVDRETGEVTHVLSRTIPGPRIRRQPETNPLATPGPMHKKQGAGR